VKLSNVSSTIEEASVALKNRWLGGIFGAAVLCASSWTTAWAQQSAPQQPSSQRDDPTTSGAGPTSGAPGQLNYDPPKSGSVTTDSRGVTTAQPKSDGLNSDAPNSDAPKSGAPKSGAPKTNEAPADFGNDSADTTPPK
jgi:hypothetical protein